MPICVGFQFAGIGPRDSETDDKLGGNLYYTGSAELRFPLGLPKELRMFGRTFVDAGSLQRHRRQRADPRRKQRPAGGRWRRPVLAVAARPAVDQFRAGDPKETKDKTEFFSLNFGTRF